VFSDAEESDLENCLKTESHVYCDLSPSDVRKFAFENAVALKKKFLKVVRIRKYQSQKGLQTSCKGMRSIRCANLRQQVSVELPVSTRLTLIFFSDNLKAVLDRLRVGPGEIWNMDEKGTTIMQPRDRVLANR
jgi:hypothetical protein